MTNAIVVEAAPRERIDITLVGVDYNILPPKWAVAMKMAVQARTTGKDDPTVMVDTVWEWVDKAFTKADAAKIRKRLDDVQDSLDLMHIMELMEKVVEATSDGNPTSSSRD